ncbi:DUF2442 domain-containing protein [Fulvivirgaceae bacterium BMA12]|uniref:DUF2442 domain-containing protein n=1 Tax=Agaribacillus aureus TaxID=3051825 RepID=A0ABT8LFG2_9BACT|nr:DUF2442 domain-containing protein [Fulvivirgaceae bacterium BMA12]
MKTYPKTVANLYRKTGIEMINAKFAVININFQDQFMYVKLMDGSIFEVALKYLPVLNKSTEKERNNWELCGNGFAICWPDLNNFILTSSELIRNFK